MTSTVELIDVDALAPDGFEPVEAFRCWTLRDGMLLSLNGGGAETRWTPREVLTARCSVGGEDIRTWNVVRRGMSREQAERMVKNDHEFRRYSIGITGRTPYSYLPYVPKTEVPDGYGFQLDSRPHDCPDAGCTCGIYAATEEALVPSGGNVYGKVKLWGKVVPGESGYRAQFAYPSEFRVAPELADDPVLSAFGVPVVVVAPPAPKPGVTVTFSASNPFNTPFHPSSKKRRSFPWLWAAVGVNLCAVAANVTAAVLR